VTDERDARVIDRWLRTFGERGQRGFDTVGIAKVSPQWNGIDNSEGLKLLVAEVLSKLAPAA
jgi:hypothetical protein